MVGGRRVRQFDRDVLSFLLVVCCYSYFDVVVDEIVDVFG